MDMNYKVTNASEDTISLLKECDSGTKMAVSSIDEVLERINDDKLKNLFTESKTTHENIGDELHKKLLSFAEDDKEPNPVAKSMSWMKTNLKLSMDESDKTVADLITDGCDMGIKSLHRYLNKYKDADDEAKKLCNELIEVEEKLRKDLQCYL